MLGSWTSKGCPRPVFSNSRGDVSVHICVHELCTMPFSTISFDLPFIITIYLFTLLLACIAKILFQYSCWMEMGWRLVYKPGTKVIINKEFSAIFLYITECPFVCLYTVHLPKKFLNSFYHNKFKLCIYDL